MGSFREHPGRKVYIVAPNKRKAQAFARKKGLRDIVPVVKVEDFPRARGLSVILLPGYDQLEDYECFFSVGGLFYDFDAFIHYHFEVA